MANNSAIFLIFQFSVISSKVDGFAKLIKQQRIIWIILFYILSITDILYLRVQWRLDL